MRLGYSIHDLQFYHGLQKVFFFSIFMVWSWFEFQRSNLTQVINLWMSHNRLFTYRCIIMVHKHCYSMEHNDRPSTIQYGRLMATRHNVRASWLWLLQVSSYLCMRDGMELFNVRFKNYLTTGHSLLAPCDDTCLAVCSLHRKRCANCSPSQSCESGHILDHSTRSSMTFILTSSSCR